MQKSNFLNRVKSSVIFVVCIVGTLVFPQLFLLHKILVVYCGAMAALEVYRAYHNPERLVAIYESSPFETVVIQMTIVIAGAIAYTQLSYIQAVAVQIGVITCDTMAYVIGRLIGRKLIRSRPFPEISPNKSFEGTIGGIVCSALAVFGWLYHSLGISNFSISTWATVFLVGLLAVCGDLMGSLTKRTLGIKDSNACTQNHPILRYFEMPVAGFGGYLDRFDSVLLTAVVLVGFQITS